LLESREQERRLLTSPELRRFLEEQKIQIVSYREFGDKFGDKFGEKTDYKFAQPSRKSAPA
jgi:hypothetical protein